MNATQRTAKVVITPVVHESHGRTTRTTAIANLADRASGEIFQTCPHTHGHKTVQAAVTCGTALWHKLPVD